MSRAGLGKTSQTQTRSKIMTTFNIDTADDRELAAEELEIVAGGLPSIPDLIDYTQKLADATGGEAFFAQVNRLVRRGG